MASTNECPEVHSGPADPVGPARGHRGDVGPRDGDEQGAAKGGLHPLSPMLVELNRDTFVGDDDIRSTVEPEAQHGTSDLQDLDLGVDEH